MSGCGDAKSRGLDLVSNLVGPDRSGQDVTCQWIGQTLLNEKARKFCQFFKIDKPGKVQMASRFVSNSASPVGGKSQAAFGVAARNRPIGVAGSSAASL